MNVIFTCGGTAGHVNPALALAGYMQERHPDLRVLFVGTPCGMERGLIEKAGYDFRSIEVSSFQRSLSPAGIAHNVKSLKNLALAGSRARAHGEIRRQGGHPHGSPRVQHGPRSHHQNAGGLCRVHHGGLRGVPPAL